MSARRRGGALLALVVAGAVASGACEDRSHRDIGDEINILTRRNDALVPPATARLASYGRAAIPQIETALHTAAATGRLHLVDALARIGDAEAAPILRHVAVYDVNREVRDVAEGILISWASNPRQPGSVQAAAAREAIARKRAAGEGPLLWGDAGAPGVPSTVGAPEPVGAALEKSGR